MSEVYRTDEAVVFERTSKMQIQEIERLRWQKTQLEKSIKDMDVDSRREAWAMVVLGVLLFPVFLLRAAIGTRGAVQVTRLKRACKTRERTIRKMHIRLKEMSTMYKELSQ